MDTGTIVVGVFIVLVCIIPLIIIGKSGSKANKKFGNAITEFARINNTDIFLFDHWNKNVIGINSERNKILYIHFNGVKEESYCINLSEIRQCKVNKESRSNSHATGQVTTTEKIALEFTPTGNEKPVIKLQFYNIDDGDFSSEIELSLAEKWKTIVEGEIKK